MKRTERKRWKPAAAVTILDKDRLGTIYLYTHPRDNKPAIVCYRGRKTRPEVHVTGLSQAGVESYGRRWLDGLREQKAQADRYREHRAQDEMSRNNVIRRIKAGLAARGFHYSVTGGRGTAWGWITIDLLPAQQQILTPGQRAEAYHQLHQALGLQGRCDSVSIAASNDYYREYIDRAEGRTPAKIATPYWD